MLHVSVLAVLVIGMSSQGNALTCLTCLDMTSDNPNIPLDMQSCGSPISMQCEAGIVQCMTMNLEASYTIELLGNITIMQTARSCGAMPFAEPNTRCLSDAEFQPIADMAKASVESSLDTGSAAIDMTFLSFTGNLCICDTDDCTPPVPSATADAGPDPTQSPTEAAAEPTTKGNALTCLTCLDMTSDNPNIPLNMESCGSPVSTQCEAGIVQCMTMNLEASYTIELVGNITIMQTARSCNAMPFAEPNTRCLSDAEFQPIANMAKASVESSLDTGSAAIDMTFLSFTGNLCICDTDDCTPPVPSATADAGTDPTQSPTEAAAEPTTKGSGATNIASSVALLFASLISALLCKAL